MKQFIMILAGVMLFASSAFGATAGNVDGIGDIDLKDVILSVQVSAGVIPIRFQTLVFFVFYTYKYQNQISFFDSELVLHRSLMSIKNTT